jgi:hypothetical protein
MSTAVVLQGTLKPDGTLELDQRPNLAPGRVQVVLQPVAGGPPPRRGLAEVIDEIRQGQQARGYNGRSADEIEADRADEADEYERRMQTLWSQTRSGPPAGGS